MANVEQDEAAFSVTPQRGQRAVVRRCLRRVDWFGVRGGEASRVHPEPSPEWRVWLESLVVSAMTALWPIDGAIRMVPDLRIDGSARDGDWVTAIVTVRGMHGAGQWVCDCQCLDAGGQVLAQGQGFVLSPLREACCVAPQVELDRFAPMVEAAQRCAALRTAVVHPCSESALLAVVEAADRGLIKPVLVGPRARWVALAQAIGLDAQRFESIDVPYSHAAAEAAVGLVRSGQAELLMKGSLHTDELLTAVLAPQGLRTERRLSHVFVMDVPSYHKLVLVTDAAINIAPGLEDKRDICQNAIELAQALGIACPKVAVLSAVETVTPKIGSTIDAAALCKMADRGQIVGGLLDGPLAMDNAISVQAAAMKGIQSAVAGDPDILLAPDLDAGNILAKQLTFLAGAESAGVVVGARVPIVLTSRADSVRARLMSCALAVLLAARYAAVAPAKTVR
jgi:phosphate acetyltransferase